MSERQQKQKPTFVIVHGAWHGPAHFEPLMTALNQHGYRTVAPELPSVHRAHIELAPDHQVDVEAVRQTILDELERGADVIVVPHSYGGLPASGAIRGLDRASRAASVSAGAGAGAGAGGDGQRVTGVVGIAAITSFLLPQGMSVPELEGRDRPQVPDLFPPPAAHLFFQDLPPAEMEKWASLLRPMSSHALYDRAAFAAYAVPGVEVHFLLATEDRAMKFATQQRVVERMREDGVAPRTEVLEGCSHSPFLSRVGDTVAFLRRSAGEDVP